MSKIKAELWSWEGSRDEEGHRTYEATYLVESNNGNDGPQTVSNFTGLPAVGSAWSWGNDSDPWAFCTPYLKIEPEIKGELTRVWKLHYKFTTKPMFRCNTATIENPLLEPDEISGSFSKRDRKTTKDRSGNLIQTTACEPIEVNKDSSIATVVIGRNEASIDLSSVAGYLNQVNSSTMWGLSARKVKFSDYSWERKLYGSCTYYYTKRMTFEIDPNTWDRSDIPNNSNKMIRGDWDEDGGFTKIESPDVNDAKDYIRAVDKNGNLIEYHLNKTTGEPSSSGTFIDTVELYTGTNLITGLGLPSSLES